MEVTKRTINYQTNEVSFTLAFTSFTGIRSGFIAPSDLITYITSQKLITIAAGRVAKYRVGWYMRLWNTLTNEFETDPPNKIVRLATGENFLLQDNGFELLADDGTNLLYDQAPDDSIEFEDNWTTPLTVNHRIRFAKYNDTEATQKRYSFISDGSNNFADGKQPYRITY